MAEKYIPDGSPENTEAGSEPPKMDSQPGHFNGFESPHYISYNVSR
jgi:hypothetical protein